MNGSSEAAQAVVDRFLQETRGMRRERAAKVLLTLVQEAVEIAQSKVVNLIDEMRERGATGIQMTWKRELGDEWGCSWTTDGRRFYAFDPDLVVAVEASLKAGLEGESGVTE